MSAKMKTTAATSFRDMKTLAVLRDLRDIVRETIEAGNLSFHKNAAPKVERALEFADEIVDAPDVRNDEFAIIFDVGFQNPHVFLKILHGTQILSISSANMDKLLDVLTAAKIKLCGMADKDKDCGGFTLKD